MAFKNMRRKRAQKNEAVVKVEGLSFTVKKISAISQEFRATFKEYVDKHGLSEKIGMDVEDKWLSTSILGTYEDDVNFFAECVVSDWDGFTDDEDNKVEFTPELFKEYFLGFEDEYEENGLRETMVVLLSSVLNTDTFALSEGDLKNS